MGILLTLARPVNLFLLAATGSFAVYLLYREAPHAPFPWIEAIWLILSALLIMAGGYWLNDLYDIEIDTINRPRRAAKVRLFTRRRLVKAVIITWILGMACTIPLWWTFKLMHLLVIGSLFWYNRYGKRLGLPGNLLVATLTALLPWEIMLLTSRTAYAVDWMIPLAAAFNFAREVIKDAEDQPGDLQYGVRSLPTTLSPKTWKNTLTLGWISLISLVLLPALLKYILWNIIPIDYLLIVAIACILPLVWGLRALQNYQLLSALLKVCMAGGLGALLFL